MRIAELNKKLQLIKDLKEAKDRIISKWGFDFSGPWDAAYDAVQEKIDRLESIEIETNKKPNPEMFTVDRINLGCVNPEFKGKTDE